MVETEVALIGMAGCFGIGALATWVVCYFWWHDRRDHGGDSGPPGTTPQPTPPPLSDEDVRQIQMQGLLDVHAFHTSN